MLSSDGNESQILSLKKFWCTINSTSQDIDTLLNKYRKLQQIKRMEPITVYPLRGLHNLQYDDVNPAMVYRFGIMSSMFATLQILSERPNLWKGLFRCAFYLIVYNFTR